LLAIAIPEQLATSQLASVPAFTSMVAFIAATAVFLFLGSNPILSIGADSTIAPLFAVALLRLALPNSPQYLSLVATTALVTGLLVALVGVLKLAWLADFLSLPIVAGFMSGIGIIIVVHQLPRVFGVTSGGASVASRLSSLAHQLSHVNAWSMVLALGTLVVMVVGEKINPRLPTALVAVVGATVLASLLSLSRHGVQELGAVVAGVPMWRLHWFSLHEWGVIVTTALTLVVVIISQSAATARAAADEIGVADDLNRDFVGIGMANVVAGLCGAMPVNASPARTTVTRLAGGRTKMVALVAVVGALLFSPLARFAHAIPLAALAGVLLFVAGRLIKISQIRRILRTSRVEFSLAIVTGLGVVVLGVELGLALAVALAILDRTWRSSRPEMVELGRRKGTTSWESLDAKGVERIDHIVVIFFGGALYFANAGIFRRNLHTLMKNAPGTRHLIVDAVAMSDIDYTGLVTLSQVVGDLTSDDVSISVARANEEVRAQLSTFTDRALRHVRLYDSVDAAANHAIDHSKG
jgi:MFS superfamily sulfate permease-like transporter